MSRVADWIEQVKAEGVPEIVDLKATVTLRLNSESFQRLNDLSNRLNSSRTRIAQEILEASIEDAYSILIAEATANDNN